VEVKPITPLSPNMNAYIERWIQTIKVECLNHFIVLGERHLEYIVREFVHFFL
jgi:putative transposase